MSDPVAVAIIGTVGTIIAAFLATQQVKLRRIDRNAREAREQVANDHIDADGRPINLRVENDERHAETRSWFRRLERSLGGIRDDFRQLRHDHAQLAERVDHLYELETTQPRSRTKE